MTTTSSSVLKVEPMGGFPTKTPDPFLFLVYHKDHYPAGDGKMQAPRRGNGQDFNPSQPYRMYHGDRIPGFPSHPHRGFETITATLDGVIDHFDSANNKGRYGDGDLQWMTAGRGIQHSEMFPLVHSDKPNLCRFFQIWLNLPKKSKFVEPHFTMHWAEDVKRVTMDKGTVTVWAGHLDEVKALPPPPESYASMEDRHVGVFHIALQQSGTYTLPLVNGPGAKNVNRRLYVIEGNGVAIDGQSIKPGMFVDLDATKPSELMNPTGGDVEVLVLQGQPIGEPVVQHGPFVMNTRQEIQQTFADYQKTRFGGWPYDDNDPVNEQSKGRFAECGGKLILPPKQK